MSRRSLIVASLALVLLVLGSFVGGYFLMCSPPPAPSPPVAIAAPEPPPPATTQAGPRLVIRSAEYGDLTNGLGMDVTDKVNAAFEGTSLSIEASNDKFGDPAFGIVKTLRVHYTLDGRDRTKSVPEGETLKIALPSGPVRLVIKKAVYGDLPDGPTSDVTEKVTDAADTGSLSISANNDNFGDPAPGIPKRSASTIRLMARIEPRPPTREIRWRFLRMASNASNRRHAPAYQCQVDTPSPILDYAAPGKRLSRPVCSLAAASLVLPMVYFQICRLMDLEPTSIAIDDALAPPSHTTFAVKSAIFAFFPLIFIALALFSIRRVRRHPTLTGIPVACAGITLNVWIIYCDISTLWLQYRGYF